MRFLTIAAAIGIGVSSALAGTYSFGVKVVGHGKPVILIPGLTCPGAVWDATVNRLKSKYECHVLTLPGFGKQPPISGPFLRRVRDDIIAYVQDKKLRRPAVIGHSLGGFMVFSIASERPKLFGRLIAVDGLPFLTAALMPKATAETVKPMAEAIAKQMATATPANFRASLKNNLAQEITNPKDVDAMLVLCSTADQATTGQAMKELLTTDLRSRVGRIESPLLLLGAGSHQKDPQQRKAMLDAYAAQIRTIRGAKFTMDWDAKHFIMVDDPRFFYSEVESFLAGR